jgi:hypothetical protein
MRDWPVVVTNRCAEACAKEFGLSQPDGARAWLYKIIDERGQVTDQLPTPVAPMKSGSGFFMVADKVVVLPLSKASDGTARWIATDCKVFPSYRQRTRGSARRRGPGQPDPLALTGAELARHINLAAAVDSYQRECGGDLNPVVAREELLRRLARDARAVTAPPDWYDAGRADFYVVAGDEYVLPMARTGGAGRVFDALACVHRAGELFRLRGAALAARCRFDEAALPSGSPRRELFAAALTAGGRLSWRTPDWARPHPAARFWVIAGKLAAPVAWQPGHPSHPLLVLDLAERLSLPDRARRWLTQRRAG